MTSAVDTGPAATLDDFLDDGPPRSQRSRVAGTPSSGASVCEPSYADVGPNDLEYPGQTDADDQGPAWSENEPNPIRLSGGV